MAKRYREGSAANKRTAKSRRRFRKVTGTALALCAAGAVSIGCFATVLAEDVPVTSSVIDGTTVYSVSIPSTDMDALLKETGITLHDKDLVVREENAEGITVTVRRQITVDVVQEDKTVSVSGHTGDTVAQMLARAGVILGKTDTVSPGLSTQLLADSTVTVSRMKQVYIADKNVVRSCLVPKGTVAEAAEAAGVILGEEDYVSDGDAQVEDGMVIHVNRVTYAEYKKTEKIDYELIRKRTDDVALGETKVEAEGADGEKTITYRQKLVNGEVVKTSRIAEDVTKEAEDRVVLIGTKVEAPELETPEEAAAANAEATTLFDSGNSSSFTDADGQRVSYKKLLAGSCTAYTGGKKTSIGMKPAVGVVAVNPNIIPYGSRLYIAAADGSFVYGYAVAGDTGGALMDGSALVDLYMNTLEDCTAFGRRNLNVYILS